MFTRNGKKEYRQIHLTFYPAASDDSILWNHTTSQSTG